MYSSQTSSKHEPLRILCLEDNDPDFELVEEYLSLAPRTPNYELKRAENLAGAIAMIIAAEGAGERFDIILTDLSVPDSKGDGTFLAIQAAAPDVAITVLTGLEDDELGLDLVKKGAQDFLPKDQLNPTFLFRSILHAIERKKNQVEVERLHADLESTRMQLIQAEKLESLGRLSAGVAHEIKNPLAMLQVCVDFYEIRGISDKDEATIHKTMQDAITRANKIVSGMLNFSRESELEIAPANLNSIVQYGIDLIAADLRREKITLVPELEEDLPEIKVDSTKIEQVVVNLLINAMHASSAGGSIEIKTYSGKIENLLHDEGLRSLEHLRSGDEVAVVEIRDHGCGIPPEKANKIYDPFFTTKATGKGTGLGLSVSKTIVNLHGGLLRIRNTEPDGVRAQVILRLSPAVAPAPGQGVAVLNSQAS